MNKINPPSERLFFEQLFFKPLSLILILVLTCSALFYSSISHAHQFSTAHAKLEPNGDNQYLGYIAVSLQDLQQALSIDPDNDGRLKWQEVIDSMPIIQAYLTNHITFWQRSGNTVSEGNFSTIESYPIIACLLDWSDSPELSELYGERLLHISVAISCPTTNETISGLSLQYGAFFDALNDHKLLLTWRYNDNESYFIIDSSQNKIVLEFVSTGVLDTISFYLYQGVIHIWLGLDHVLFVLALILPFAWLRFRRGRFSSTQSLVLKDLIVLITSFTLAHSITLTLTALNLLSIPSQWAEIGIAISVAFTAINIITQWVNKLGIITFLFGLLHGMGFAGALSELGLSQTYKISSIVAFNLGVEIGQVAIIFLLYPLLTRLRKTQTLQYRLVPTLAVLITLMGGYWIIERI
ncbi:HupE/UreJ family protein [Kangiella sp.]|uniref:HupE/UreJ family protein n=1 Tax=Kangiella sp. TaxID=1920245 RepID=UPI0019C66B86|nr:HupE/UreJ family protein [Kangiella sp.]MBD3653046.1 HupE/UreJ family protein [Kangiella sp.]